MREYHGSPAPTSDAFRERLRTELQRNGKRVPRSIIESTTPWQLLVYMLVKGKLGRVFDKKTIAYMVNPHQADMATAHLRVDLALARFGLTAD